MSTSAAAEEATPAWDDGFADLRLLLRGFQAVKVADVEVPIGTLRDMHWYVTWAEVDPTTADLRGVKAVGVGDVLETLGVTACLQPSSPDATAGLLMAALPSYKNQAEARLNSEFQWSVPIKLARGTLPSKTEAVQPPFAAVIWPRRELRLDEGSTTATLVYEGRCELARYKISAGERDGKKTVRYSRWKLCPDGWSHEPPNMIEVVLLGERRVQVFCDFEGGKLEKCTGHLG